MLYCYYIFKASVTKFKFVSFGILKS